MIIVMSTNNAHTLARVSLSGLPCVILIPNFCTAVLMFGLVELELSSPHVSFCCVNVRLHTENELP